MNWAAIRKYLLLLAAQPSTYQGLALFSAGRGSGGTHPRWEQQAMIGRKRLDDLKRVVIHIVLGVLAIRWTPDLARAIHVPELSNVGLSLGWLSIAVGVSHAMRRALFPGIDLRQLMALAVRDHQAGWVVLGICFVLGCLILGAGSVRAQDLPPNARTYLPILAAEQSAHWPEADLATLAAQVEHETCVSLKSPRCWSPRAELKTAREQGVGFPQITRTARFDSLRMMVNRHPRELAGWDWNSPTLYDPRLQARALVLMGRDNQGVADGAATEADRWAMILVAHNGGPERVRSDRRLCAGTQGCDPTRWWGHVERTSLLQRAPKVQGYGLTFFEVTRRYPRDILLVRRDRYVGAL